MKKVVWIISLMGVILLLAACGNKVSEEDTAKYKEKVEQVVQQLNEQQYEAIVAQFDAKMKAELSVEQLATIEPVLTQSGTLQTLTKHAIQEKDGIIVAVVVGEHTEEDRVYTVSFNAQDEIVGLFVQ